MANPDALVPGDTVEITIPCRVRGTTLTTPTSATLQIMNPAGVVVVTANFPGTITNPSAGILQYDFTLPASTAQAVGQWSWRIVTTAPAAGADEGDFFVKPSRFV